MGGYTNSLAHTREGEKKKKKKKKTMCHILPS